LTSALVRTAAANALPRATAEHGVLAYMQRPAAQRATINSHFAARTVLGVAQGARNSACLCTVRPRLMRPAPAQPTGGSALGLQRRLALTPVAAA
jgi:hypothetical protein